MQLISLNLSKVLKAIWH